MIVHGHVQFYYFVYTGQISYLIGYIHVCVYINNRLHIARQMGILIAVCIKLIGRLVSFVGNSYTIESVSNMDCVIDADNRLVAVYYHMIIIY